MQNYLYHEKFPMYSTVLKVNPYCALYTAILLSFSKYLCEENIQLRHMYIAASCIELLMGKCYHSIGSQTCGI